MQSNLQKVSFSVLGEAFKYAQSLKAFLIFMGTLLATAVLCGLIFGLITMIGYRNQGLIAFLVFMMTIFSILAINVGYIGASSVIMSKILNKPEPSYKQALLHGLYTFPKVILVSIISLAIFLGFIIISLLLLLVTKIPLLGSILSVVIYPAISIGIIVLVLFAALILNGLAVPSFLVGNSFSRTFAVMGMKFNITSFKNLFPVMLELFTLKVLLIVFTLLVIYPLIVIGLGYSFGLSSAFRDFYFNPWNELGPIIGSGIFVFFMISLVIFTEFACRALVFLKLQARFDAEQAQNQSNAQANPQANVQNSQSIQSTQQPSNSVDSSNQSINLNK